MKEGDVFFLSEGDYSDYTILSIWKALKDFDIEEVFAADLVDARIQDTKTQPGGRFGGHDMPPYTYFYYNTDRMSPALMKGGYAEELPMTEYHVDGAHSSHPVLVNRGRP